MLALHYHISFGYVDAVADSAVYLRQVLVHLEYDYIGLVQYPLGDARGTGQIEIPVVIHRRHCDHSDIYLKKMLVVLDNVPENHRYVVAESLVAEFPFICGTVPAVVYEMLALGVALHHLYRPEDQIASYLDVCELVSSPGESFVQKHRKAVGRGVFHPVSAFDDFDRLVRRAELFSVLIIVFHK